MHFILLRKMKARLPNDDVSRSNTMSIDFWISVEVSGEGFGG